MPPSLCINVHWAAIIDLRGKADSVGGESGDALYRVSRQKPNYRLSLITNLFVLIWYSLKEDPVWLDLQCRELSSRRRDIVKVVLIVPAFPCNGRMRLAWQGFLFRTFETLSLLWSNRGCFKLACIVWGEPLPNCYLIFKVIPFGNYFSELIVWV